MIRTGLFHSIKALSKRGVKVLEFETPIKKNDLVRYQDDYGRIAKPYEGVKYIKSLNNKDIIFKKPSYDIDQDYEVNGVKIKLKVSLCLSLTLKCGSTFSIPTLILFPITNSADSSIILCAILTSLSSLPLGILINSASCTGALIKNPASCNLIIACLKISEPLPWAGKFNKVFLIDFNCPSLLILNVPLEYLCQPRFVVILFVIATFLNTFEIQAL